MKKQVARKRQAPSSQDTARYDRITRLEAQILEKVQKLKANTRSCICEHFSLEGPDPGPYDSSVNYYDKFWKRFMLNEIGKQNILQFRSQIDNFSKRLEKVQNLFREWSVEVQPYVKAKRKSSKMQEGRGQMCPHCRRTYKDEQTLLIHIKIKHQEAAQQMQSGESIFEQDIDE